MKKREFRFNPILNYRIFIEDLMKKELSEVTEILNTEEMRLFALEEIKRKAIEEFMERDIDGGEPIHVHRILTYHTYLQEISSEIESQKKRVVEVQQMYEEKRDSLLHASMERKIMEKVREKDLKKLFEEERAREKKAIDEAARDLYLRDIE